MTTTEMLPRRPERPTPPARVADMVFLLMAAPLLAPNTRFVAGDGEKIQEPTR